MLRGYWQVIYLSVSEERVICVRSRRREDNCNTSHQMKTWIRELVGTQRLRLVESMTAGTLHNIVWPRIFLFLFYNWLCCLPIVYRKLQFSSVSLSCPTLCNPMNCSMPGLPVHHQLPESTQTHVPWVGDAIQPSYPLSSPSLPALNLSQHQGLLQWVSSPHQVTKILEFQLQDQSFQWTPRTDLL